MSSVTAILALLVLPVIAYAASDPIIGGLTEHDIILANETGLIIARIQIDSRTLDTVSGKEEKALVSVTPTRHHLKVVFRGGANVDWPHLDFSGVHEIFFQRNKNKIEARIE